MSGQLASNVIKSADLMSKKTPYLINAGVCLLGLFATCAIAASTKLDEAAVAGVFYGGAFALVFVPFIWLVQFLLQIALQHVHVRPAVAWGILIAPSVILVSVLFLLGLNGVSKERAFREHLSSVLPDSTSIRHYGYSLTIGSKVQAMELQTDPGELSARILNQGFERDGNYGVVAGLIEGRTGLRIQTSLPLTHFKRLRGRQHEHFLLSTNETVSYYLSVFN